MARLCCTYREKTPYKWVIKGIHNVSELYSGGVFISFSELKQKYDWDGKDNFWKFLQIRDSITKGQFFRDKNPVMEFIELMGIVCRASVFCRVGFENSLRSVALQVLDTHKIRG